MFIEYIQAAMRRAKYELLPDGEGYYAEIPGFKGLWANADTLEGCREELLGTLQDWMLIRMDHSLPLPVVDGINVNPNRLRRRTRPPPRAKATRRSVA
jgi:predicted RNase H-like HicB family nuclease